MAAGIVGYVGPYRLLNVVHTGQTSQIWQAFHDGKGQIFGLKFLMEKFRRDREQTGYLRWEYAVGGKIDHPRIIHVIEYAVDRRNPYLALEWFSAPNLKQRIQQGLDVIGHQVPTIIEQAAEGLAYFNSLGWVHRDIKPDNFLVADDGSVKLIDFALARRSKRGLGKLFSTKEKIQGTRSYMAPEQIRGAPVDCRADVYSFGCTMHELLSGKPPYTGISADELLRKHLRSPPPTLQAVNKNVTPEFAQLVLRCLAKNPNQRPESLDEFLRELRVIKVFKIPPRPPTEATKTKR